MTLARFTAGILAGLLVSGACFFLPVVHATELEQPRTASLPKTSPRNRTPEFGCKRDYIYQGEVRSVDSIHRQDGEGLRSVLSREPEALRHLEVYQQNRRNYVQAAYLGSAGLGLILLGGLAKSLATTPTTGDLLNRIGLVSGLALIGGGLTYSFLVLKNNEAHLGLAVKSFNNSRAPQDQIELQFETGLRF